ncbi:hypothetical protein CC78DRAFT_3496 [Lojkania enalia]|uniref:Uncharacterized protein n=1 Tax=Lojkania enalia TaxID=147567 RepID=A0A9P4NCP9_9PLEO|nr:hypothetical protein CC78DRAFT_3496 [Didymosphaeria enalia]
MIILYSCLYTFVVSLTCATLGRIFQLRMVVTLKVWECRPPFFFFYIMALGDFGRGVLFVLCFVDVGEIHVSSLLFPYCFLLVILCLGWPGSWYSFAKSALGVRSVFCLVLGRGWVRLYRSGSRSFFISFPVYLCQMVSSLVV